MRVDLDAVLPRSEPGKMGRLALALLWSGAIVVSTVQAIGGEKIKISDTPEKFEVPKDLNRELVTPKELMPSGVKRGESSDGPTTLPPGQPGMMRNPMLDEFLDRKKNWIFYSPNNLDRDKAIQNILGVKEYDFQGLEKKSKTVIESYYEAGKEKKNNDLQSRSPDSNGNRDSLGRRNEFESNGNLQNPQDSKERGADAIIPALNPAILFNWNVAPDPLSQGGEGINRSLLPPGLGDGPLGQKPNGTPGPARESNPAPRDNEKLWDIRNSPLNRLNDPINMQADGTRSIMNPIAARKASVPAPDSNPAKMSAPLAFGNSGPVTARPDMFVPTRSMPTAASFAPAILAPANASIMQPKPIVLEIPRPKF